MRSITITLPKNILPNSPQKIIISASRRTDIPAFFPEWFINRVRAGFCKVVNPYNPAQISRVSLKPEDVAAFVFWTRDPGPLMPYLKELDERGYGYYFLYTVLGYPRQLDPFAPDIEKSVEIFRRLSAMIGKDKVIWRYDPLILSNLTPLDWHFERVAFLMGEIGKHCRAVITSVVEPYAKTRRRMFSEAGADLVLDDRVFDKEAYSLVFERIGKLAAGCNIQAYACAQEMDLSTYGIDPAQCVDTGLINMITGGSLVYKKDPYQRKRCRCNSAKDIGVNNTCLFGCRYCYATNSLSCARENHHKHDKNSEFLI